MKKVKVLRHTNQARNIKKRPATHSDVSKKIVPPRSPRNIRRGHLIVGMRDMMEKQTPFLKKPGPILKRGE